LELLRRHRGSQHQLQVVLGPAGPLALAENAGHDVVAPCALCFNRLTMAEKALLSPDAACLNVSYGDSIKIWDLLDYLSHPKMLKTLPLRW
jgi:heterodisulfide reductase subunit B